MVDQASQDQASLKAYRHKQSELRAQLAAQLENGRDTRMVVRELHHNRAVIANLKSRLGLADTPE